MNGIHDLGGMDGLGPIEREENEPVFHHDWERRVFGLFVPLVSIAAESSVDEFRFAVERMAPGDYLDTSYYEHWLHALETLAIERGLVTVAELAAGRAAGEAIGEPGLRPDGVPRVVASGHSARVETGTPPHFRVGDRVRARNLNPFTHTRLPRYVRGRVGVIERAHGGFALPDTMATRQGESPQHCYSVRFEAEALWGRDAAGRDAVYIDLFDDYLEPA